MAGVFVFLLTLVVIGLLCYLAAFLSWHRKRVVENLPRSKIRSMAMGLVEVAGNPEGETLFTAPFSQKPCIYYQYEMQEVRTAKGGSYWVSILQGQSERTPFTIQDDTGRSVVDPKQAKLELNVTFDMTVEHHAQVPEHLAAFLEAAHYRYKNWFDQHCTMRFRERAILPGEPIYVMGVCQKGPGGTVFIGKRLAEIFFIASDSEQDMTMGLHRFMMNCTIFGAIFLLLGIGGIWWIR